MANKKISDLVELTTPSPTDKLAIVNQGITKSITVENLVAEAGFNAANKAKVDNITVTAAVDLDEIRSRVLEVGCISATEKGALNGVATLDSSGKLPTSQLPISAMEWKGNYNISTNTPNLVDGTGNTGDVFKNTVDGTRNFGSGSITVKVGDFLIYNGTTWELSKNSDPDLSGTEIVTYANLITKYNAGTLSPGVTYRIDMNANYIGDYSIWIDALDVNKLSHSCKLGMTIISNSGYLPGYSSPTLGVWKTNLVPTIGGVCVWGAYLWTNLTGNVGSVVDDKTLDSTNWSRVSGSNYVKMGSSFYVYKTFDIEYDFVNNIVDEIRDDRGNIVVQDISRNSMNWAMTDWGYSKMSNNRTQGVFNNLTGTELNALQYGSHIYNNNIDGVISRNVTNGIFGNVVKGDLKNNTMTDADSGVIHLNISYDISDNNVALLLSNKVDGIIGNTSTGSLENNEGLQISGNSNTGSIISNKCEHIVNNSNTGNIDNNSIRELSDNSNIGDISSNTCFTLIMNSNSGSITNNIVSNIISNNDVTIGSIMFNNIHGDISGNFGYNSSSNNSISYNNCGSISDNLKVYSITYNSCQNIQGNGNSVAGGYIKIYNNQNTGNISSNNLGVAIAEIYSNSNAGEISSNTTKGSIYKNSNGGFIKSNANNGSIYLNSNAGDINNNTVNVTNIFNNSNLGVIATNSMKGVISYNSNSGYITSNTHSSGTCDISYNTNNINITGARTANVIDTGRSILFNAQTSSYTLVLTDANKMITIDSSSANTLTLPLDSSVNFVIGTQISVNSIGTGQTSIVAASGVTINSKSGNLKLTGQYSGATLIKTAANTWLLTGDLSA